jgi:hypothetical protein
MVSDPKRLTAHESGATRYCQMLWIGVARQLQRLFRITGAALLHPALKAPSLCAC